VVTSPSVGDLYFQSVIESDRKCCMRTACAHFRQIFLAAVG
jgi:hypothetical protein